MSEFSFKSVYEELSRVEESGLTFAGGSLKWTTADDVQEVTSAIDNCKSLTFLKLEGNTLGVDAAAAIGKSLEKHPEFKKALWRDMFTGRLKSEIPQALEHLGNGLKLASAQLTVLDCSDNALGPNGMVGLEGLLRSRVCFSLKELHLNNCGLGIYGGEMLSNAILDCYKNSCDAGTPLDLKVFIAGRNRLENKGAKYIAKIFCTINTLEEIAMPQNSIYQEGIADLCEGFKNNPNMRVLNLNDNTITTKGASAIANAITFMPRLKEINLGDCLLRTNGAYHLAEVLQDGHDELETLILDANEIRPDGGLALVSALENKPNLKCLSLDANKFGFDCIEQIKDIMSRTSNPSALGSFDDDEDDDDDVDDGQDDDEENQEEEEEEDNEEADHCENTAEEEDEDDTNYRDESGEDDDGTTANYVTALCNKTLDDTVEGSIGFQSDTSVTFAADLSRKSTLETFCFHPNPSLKMFEDVGEGSDKLKAFREYFKAYECDNYLYLVIFAALKCASLATVSKEALGIAVELYTDAFAFADKVNQVNRLMNFFLVQFGLMRCENKKFKPVYNLKSCRYAFREALKEKQLPQNVKQTFTLFLDRFDD